jgi:hypothetical protein
MNDRITVANRYNGWAEGGGGNDGDDASHTDECEHDDDVDEEGHEDGTVVRIQVLSRC